MKWVWYDRDFRYSVSKTNWRFSYSCNYPVRKHLIWSVTRDWRKWTRRVQPLERSNRRTRMWCHPWQSRVSARYGGLPGKRRVLQWRELRPWLMVCGRDSPRKPPPPSRPLPPACRHCGRAPLGTGASETQHPEDGERQGGGETELNGVRVSGRLKKSPLR